MTAALDLEFLDSLFAKFQAWREEQLVLEDGRRLGDVVAPFQRERFEAWDTKRRVYCESCTGSSKTTDVAGWVLSMLRWLQGWEAAIYAVDRGQARKVLDAAEGFVRRNPDLRKYWGLEIQRNRIVSTKSGGWCSVESSDVASAEGLLADCAICEQLESWPREDLWESVFSRSHKREMKVIIIANAPYSENDWPHRIREWARRDPAWAFLEYIADDVPWFTEKSLAESRAGLRPATFERLFYNVVGAGEDVFLLPAQIDAIETLAGPAEAPFSGYTALAAGCDYGRKRDATAVSVLGVKGNEIHLLDQRVLVAPRNGEVMVEDVERELSDVVKAIDGGPIFVDPYEMVGVIQRRGREWNLKEFSFFGSTWNTLTTKVYAAVRDRILRIYPNASPAVQHGEPWSLRRELGEIVVREMAYGSRLDHRQNGHDDRAVSIFMALPYLLDRIGGWRPWVVFTDRAQDAEPDEDVPGDMTVLEI